ncbi:hypothetical protein ACWEN6_37300 [Sphaerisporangium sp. NPDC004334]
MTDRMFARLKPAVIDELTEETYHRRRAADLARALGAPRTAGAPPARRPFRRVPAPGRPLLLVAGATAAGLAAATIVVPRLAAPPARPGPPSASATAGATASPLLGARSVLLAAAATAERAPAASGRYWYTRERVAQKVREIPGRYETAMKALAAELQAKRRELAGDPGRLKAYTEDFERRVTELKRTAASSAAVPFAALTEETQESWRAREKGDHNRTMRDKQGRVVFASPADEEKWKRMGSPRLTQDRPRSQDDDLDLVLSIGNPQLTIRNVSRLPADADALAGRLRELYRRNAADRPEDTTYSLYLWQTGLDLLTAPITPGTRSALFRVLAGEQGLVSEGQVTDALGRAGVALSASGPGDDGEKDAIGYRLVLDATTSRVLQYEVTEKGSGTPLLRVAYEDMAWVDRLGERPRR